MKRIGLFSLLVVAVLVIGAVLPLAAQEATPEATEMSGDMSGQTGMLTNCDSSLILLVGLAQRYFGYTPETGLDLMTFEYGQFGGLYDMSTMGDMSSTGSTDANTGTTAGNAGDGTSQNAGEGTGEAGNSGSVGGTGSASSDTMMASGTTLNPPSIADEDPFCTQLRMSVESFFSNAMMQSDWDTRFRSGMGGMTGTDATSSGG